MIPIPSPLHPAVVHFPIVLILIGTAIACAAVVLRRWHLPAIAAVCLSLGAVGSVAATVTGGADEEMVGELGQPAENVLEEHEEHEEWGETTRNLALVAAVLSIAGALLGRFPIPARVAGAIAAIIAISASFAVAQTGHYGGRLVYRHGAGVNTAAGAAAGEAAEGEAAGGSEGKGGKNHKDDDDD